MNIKLSFDDPIGEMLENYYRGFEEMIRLYLLDLGVDELRWTTFEFVDYPIEYDEITGTVKSRFKAVPATLKEPRSIEEATAIYDLLRK